MTLVWIDQVLVDELRRPGVVGEDAADLRRGEKDVVGPLACEELLHGGLVREVELRRRPQQQLAARSRCRRRTSAEPTRPRWPATKIAGCMPSLGVLVGLEALAGHQRVALRLVAGPRATISSTSCGERDLGLPAELGAWPWTGRRAACPPRSGGSSAGRRATSGLAATCGRRRSSSTPLPAPLDLACRARCRRARRTRAPNAARRWR